MLMHIPWHTYLTVLLEYISVFSDWVQQTYGTCKVYCLPLDVSLINWLTMTPWIDDGDIGQ